MKNLNQIRQELDQIDNQILELISRRLALQPAVAEFKKANGLEIFQSKREQDLLNHKKSLAKDLGISEDLIGKIFIELMEEGKRIQKLS